MDVLLLYLDLYMTVASLLNSLEGEEWKKAKG